MDDNFLIMIRDFINNTFFYYFLFALVFGLLLYGTLGIDGMDEICALLLLVFFVYAIFQTSDWYVDKSFLVTLCIFLFYLFYSFYIGSNTKKAIVSDFIIQFKPYLSFFAVYYLKPSFNANQKSLLRIICAIFWSVLLLLGILSIFDNKIIDILMFHVAFYAACVIALSLIFYYCGGDTSKDKWIFILMLSVGLFSTRSKFYGFYVMSIMLMFLSPYIKDLKINFKTIMAGLVILAGIILVGWQKIDLYFAISGDVEDIESGLLARLTLYTTSFEVLQDYFPLGSGFASFASYSSGVYYSPLYAKYGIDKIWGMNSTDYSYIADTYYPCLAQFGVVGILLFCSFFFFIIRKAFMIFKKTQKPKNLVISLMIIGYFLIESIADATFTGHRGLFMMTILGLIFADRDTPSALPTKDEKVAGITAESCPQHS